MDFLLRYPLVTRLLVSRSGWLQWVGPASGTVGLGLSCGWQTVAKALWL